MLMVTPLLSQVGEAIGMGKLTEALLPAIKDLSTDGNWRSAHTRPSSSQSTSHMYLGLPIPRHKAMWAPKPPLFPPL